MRWSERLYSWRAVYCPIHLNHKCLTNLSPLSLHVCQNNVPAGVSAPPLDTQFPCYTLGIDIHSGLIFHIQHALWQFLLPASVDCCSYCTINTRVLSSGGGKIDWETHDSCKTSPWLVGLWPQSIFPDIHGVVDRHIEKLVCIGNHMDWVQFFPNCTRIHVIAY